MKGKKESRWNRLKVITGGISLPAKNKPIFVDFDS